jgi:hypothetical protein
MGDATQQQALPRLCFVHLPKTGGTTIRNHLFQIYGTLAFGATTTEDYAVVSDEVLARYRFYSGHPYRRDWSRLPPDTKFLIVLRDPVDRVISLYKYWRTIGTSFLELRGDGFACMLEALHIAQTVQIEAFIMSENAFIVGNVRNAYARQLVPDTMVYSCHIDGRPSVAAFEEALKKLFRFDAVLTTERLDQSFPQALRRLGLPAADGRLGRANVSTSNSAYNRQQIEDIMIRISPMDFSLYNVGQQIEARHL